MSDHEDLEWEQTGDTRGTFQMQCSDLKKDGYVMLEGRPCKIVEMTTSKAGKHGSAKVDLVGTDIFTGKTYKGVFGSNDDMDVPNVNRTEYTLINIEKGFLSLMDDNGDMHDDVKLPDGDLGKEISTLVEDGENLLVPVTTTQRHRATSVTMELIATFAQSEHLMRN
ncbi:PREDICTED: eukaryotic translation initiation factor 5A-1-like isoform X2 [Branchiostoma belcheri]|nr:PREDICTED: eukaryotic translation initiation factor 5A-1-like isoform X2 [Branchiostoma belcheri]XP_019619814.1 PREDICTED: eukaryotic translation initiation factor 5A-1-like isoform X2 [Branchiostoma belcheri]XP_019619815.1 PREDICTED: eukaryotic translation initiation factor 5A-1-like isoform X2 [Branchiostoma belcheri]